MKNLLPIATKAVLAFVALFLAQWFIPWYLLSAGALIAGIFTVKTGDSHWGYGLVLAAIAFGLTAYLIGKYYPQ